MNMKTKYIIAIAAATLMLAGCSRNDLGAESSGSGEGLLKFRVAGAGVKGALINNEEQMLAADVDNFMVESWNENCSKFVELQKVSYDAETAEWQTAKPIEWKGEDEKTFFAYANLPASGATVENTCTSAPAVRKQTLEYTLPLDAREQNDIMLGWYGGDGGGETTATVNFVHPLSSIRLVRGAMNVDAIKSITISGLYESGTVDVTYAKGAEDKVVPTYSWGDSRTGSVESKLEPDNGKSSLEIAEDGTIGTPFIVIPQDGVSAVKVTVNALLDGEEKVLSVKFPTSVTKLEAGKTYELTLGYGDFTFALNNPADAILSFNTTEASAKEIELTSTLSMNGATPAFVDWNISRVIVGASDAEQVTENSWSGNGLTVTKTGTGDAAKLQITADARTLAAPGSHDYWVGDNGGWSPADWTTETSSAPIDLSKFDFETDTKNAHAMTTANCYIIRHAGTYKIPLVYGNAVQGGSVNSDAYAPVMAAEGSNFLSPFLNHREVGITSAFIENNSDCTAASAAIVWQDMATVIKGLSIVGSKAGTYDTGNVRYLQFTVDNANVCQNNAIIAVRDASDNIMWSWHIWTTNDPTLLSGPIAVTNYTDKKYDFFPLYNLGWIDKGCYPAKDDVKIVLAQQKLGKEMEITVKQSSVLGEASNGCYYQFGRKDPMPPTKDVIGFTINSTLTTASLSAAITNPNIFYKVSSGDWCSTTYYNLWTGKKSTTGTIDQDADMIKTIYDPSPVGYKMPASNAFTGFTTTGGNTSNKTQFNVANPDTYNNDKGWYFVKSSEQTESTPTIFFPAAGYRDYNDGSVNNVGSDGSYWSAVPRSANNGYYLGFSPSGVNPVNDYNRALGFSVRPVQE